MDNPYLSPRHSEDETMPAYQQVLLGAFIGLVIDCVVCGLIFLIS